MSFKVCPPNCIDDCKECALEIMKLRAFGIMKDKRVNLEYLKCSETYEQYCFICGYGREITQEEFKLLKASLDCHE